MSEFENDCWLDLAAMSCHRCGHNLAEHHRTPSCRVCRCNNDPKCMCGDLTSKHPDRPEGDA